MDIRKINNDRDYLEWDEWQLDYWEMFDDPQDITVEEYNLVKTYLYMMNIDINQQEIITFRAAPVHFAHMIVNLMRRLKSQNPENFPGNFAKGIDPEL